MSGVERRETFRNTRLAAEVLLDVKAAISSRFEGEIRRSGSRRISTGDVTWTFESDAQFFEEYRRGAWSSFTIGWANVVPSDQPLTYDRFLSCDLIAFGSRVDVTIEGWNREDVLAVQEVFERHREASAIPATAEEPGLPVTVFVGHGRDPAWRDLKDHLQDLHGYRVVAYEVGARAGHEVRDVLEEMLSEAAFACLVMTGEDQVDGDRRQARQNVIHELGLFQGRIGFHRAIALVEDEIVLPSNIAGVTQLRFSSGGIRSTFGGVLATLRREFGDARAASPHTPARVQT